MILTDISFERISEGKRSRFETESNRQYLPLSREVVLVQIFNQTVTITAKSHTKVRKWERKCMSRGHPQLKKRKRNYSNNSIIIDNYSLDSWELFCRYSPRLKRKDRQTQWSQQHSMPTYTEENHSKSIRLTSFKWITLNYPEMAKQSDCLKHRDHCLNTNYLTIIPWTRVGYEMVNRQRGA